MQRNQEAPRMGSRRSGAVWAALALSAGLATAPVAALAEESAGTAAGTGSDGSATTQDGGTQTAPQASESGTQGAASQGTGTQTGTQGQAAAAEQKAPAASSDKGTYERAGLHAVTVTYVDQSGRQIAPSYKRALADGESYSAKSPTVGGYELADASQATVAGTVSKGSGDVTVRVVYRSTMVTYRVVHERQVGPRSSQYRVSETETLQAPAGTRVTAVPKSYDNYRCVTTDLSTDVTPDGKATIVVRYDVIVPSYGVYFSTSGSYVAPITGKVGDAVTAPANPTRAGYSFAGWDTDGDGSADALPTTIPDHDVTAVAVWKPARATYLVKYWGEDSGKEGSYHLLKTESLTGTTDSETPTAAKLDTARGATYQWYTYLREGPVKIAGDGTSVLNVYYDLKTVTLHVKVLADGLSPFNRQQVAGCPDMIDPIKVKLFGTVSLPSIEDTLKFYWAHGGKRKNFERWRDPVTTWVIGQNPDVDWNSTTIDKDGNLTATYVATFKDSEIYSNYVIDVKQSKDGKGYQVLPAYASRTGNPWGQNWVARYESRGFRVVAWRVSTNVWDGKDASTIKWGDWHVVTAKDVGKDGYVSAAALNINTANVTEFKSDRIPYDVTYYSDGQVVGTKTQLYGSEIDVSTPAGLTAPEGMVFGGWYTTPDFSGDPVTSLTMPEGGVHLYARWKRPDVRVTFDSAGGSAVAPETVAWGSKAKAPANPTREGYTFGGWYYQAPGSSTPAPFPFDLGLEGDVSLVAAWKSNNTAVAYRVVHRTSDGRVLYEETGTGNVGQTLTEYALGAHDAKRAGYAYVNASGITRDLSADADNNVYEFVYSTEPTFRYVVHFYNEKDGLPVAADVTFDSERALLDYAAPAIKGYHVLFGGNGYLSTREGGQELTFWYERDPEQPATPQAGGGNTSTAGQTKAATLRTATAPAAKVAPRHMAKAATAKAALPRTGDSTSAALPLGIGALGAGVAVLGSRLRRREDEE